MRLATFKKRLFGANAPELVTLIELYIVEINILFYLFFIFEIEFNLVVGDRVQN